MTFSFSRNQNSSSNGASNGDIRHGNTVAGMKKASTTNNGGGGGGQNQNHRQYHHRDDNDTTTTTMETCDHDDENHYEYENTVDQNNKGYTFREDEDDDLVATTGGAEEYSCDNGPGGNDNGVIDDRSSFPQERDWKTNWNRDNDDVVRNFPMQDQPHGNYHDKFDDQGFDPHGASVLADEHNNCNEATFDATRRVDYFTEQDPMLTMKGRNESDGSGREELNANQDEDCRPNTNMDEDSDLEGIGDMLYVADFGKSVHVINAERRLVLDEINDYEAKIKTAKTSLNQEKQIESGLTRSKDIADRDLQDMVRNTEDLLESSITYKDIMKSIVATVERDIIAKTNGSTSLIVAPVTPNAINGLKDYSDQADAMHSLVSLEEVLRQDTSQTAAIKSDLFQSNKEYQRLLDDVKELKESSINREKREQEKQAKEEMHQKEADLANARSHLKQLSDDLQSTLNRAATEAKALGDMSKELNELKVKLAAEEEERRKQAELSKRELEELQKEDADLDARLAQIEAQKQLGLEQLSRFNRFLSTHDNNKKKLLAIVDEKAAKLDMLEQLEKCDDETRNQLKASLIRLEEAKNSKAASEKIRIANDEKEKSILLPAKEELRELESKKQDLTSNISLVHSELEEQELKESEELERMISEKADLEAKIDVMNKRVKLKTMEEEATTNAHMKWMEDIELQISQQRKREHTFNQAIETTEKETYKVNKKEAEDSYMAKIESMKMKFKMKERSKHRYHSILKTAAEMLDDVLATELEADANPGSRGADEDEETDREY